MNTTQHDPALSRIAAGCPVHAEGSAVWTILDHLGERREEA